MYNQNAVETTRAAISLKHLGHSNIYIFLKILRKNKRLFHHVLFNKTKAEVLRRNYDIRSEGKLKLILFAL